ncbi:transketolase family protein [Polynucleobacter sp. JS-JIR-5-A7]|uniref:transketolase family protein n=1 Tax=Polynucleobacter sp. JS-JIR-5-A7 TaxID=1758395 RepID=UPI001BFD4542|nr:transketolase [Polynucleobacter sp. JS-JIR-5-A7]
MALQAELNENIALVVGDLGYGVVESFANRFPKRFFNAGVAEQNMMGLSAGLASEGFHVFVYSIANFPTFRCAEQIRNDVDYHKLPVTVVAVGGGLAYGNLGYSHHAVQDYALMRALPNMLIAAPGDPMEVRSCMRYIIQHPQPSYLRLGKSGEPCIHDHIPDVSPGEWLSIRSGAKGGEIFLTTGSTLNFVDQILKTSPELRDYSLSSMPLWGMKFKKNQPNQVVKYQKIRTIEDHLIDGGFGSWLLESMATNSELMMRINVKALNDRVCGLVGSQSALNLEGGLTKLQICE